MDELGKKCYVIKSFFFCHFLLETMMIFIIFSPSFIPLNCFIFGTSHFHTGIFSLWNSFSTLLLSTSPLKYFPWCYISLWVASLSVPFGTPFPFAWVILCSPWVLFLQGVGVHTQFQMCSQAGCSTYRIWFWICWPPIGVLGIFQPLQKNGKIVLEFMASVSLVKTRAWNTASTATVFPDNELQ